MSRNPAPPSFVSTGVFRAAWLLCGLAWIGSPVAGQEPELLEVPEPSLATLERSVQDQLRREREKLETVLGGQLADRETLGAAFGRMGQFYLVYSVAEATEPCLINAGRLQPEDFRWPYYLANLYVNAGDLEAARRGFQRAVELGPRYVAAKLRLGHVQYEQGDLESAEVSFQAALKLAPMSPGAYQGLGRIARERQQYDLAIGHFQKALELQPEAASLHHELAMAFRQQGDAALAREHLRQYEDRPVQLMDPVMAELKTLLQGPEVHFKRGVDALREGDALTASREFEATIEFTPEDSVAHYYLALAVLRIWRSEQQPEQLERGLAELQRALELRPEYRDAHYVLGSMMGRLGEVDQALFHFAEAHRIDPDYLDGHLEWAVALGKTGEVDRALSEMQAVVEADPTFARAQVARATLLIAEERFGEALEHYLRAVEYEEPLSSETAMVAATLAGRAGRFQDASVLFEKAIALDPVSIEAHSGRAMALILEGRDSDAAGALESSRRALPDNRPLAHLQARFLATCSDDSTRDAIRALSLAMDIHSQAPASEHAETVAMALAAVGRFEEAVTWQARVVEDLQGSGSTLALEVASSRLELYRAGKPVLDPWSALAAGS